MTEEALYEEMRANFEKLYDNKISPWLAGFEETRIKKYKLSQLLSKIIWGVSIIFFIFILDKIMESIQILLLPVVINILVVSIIKKMFENKIKKDIMPPICKCFGNLIWSQGRYDNESLIKDSNVVPKYTASSFDDIFQGSYKGVSYDIIESHMSTGGSKSRETVFSGVIVKLKMNKNFVGKTIILPDSSNHKSPVKNLRYTELEDIVFESKFDVFTDDEVEARYLITTGFMEKLNNMMTSFFASKISCSFYNDSFLVALDTGGQDLFSICSLDKPINDRKQFFRMFEEILSIIKLIDYFKLDQKIGL